MGDPTPLNDPPASSEILQAIEALRDDVRRVGRAVLAGRPEPRPEARSDVRSAAEDDRWAVSLLPTVDSLDRCLRAGRALGAELAVPRRIWWVTVPGDPRGHALAGGVHLALQALEDALASRGFRLERPTAVPFDAARHCAVATEVGEQAGLVVRTERAGLSHGDRLVREANVVVTTKTGEGR